MMKPRTSLLAIGILVAILSACEKKQAADQAGPAQKAGQQIDQAASRAGEELNKAAGKVGQSMAKAGQKLQNEASEARKDEAQNKQ